MLGLVLWDVDFFSTGWDIRIFLIIGIYLLLLKRFLLRSTVTFFLGLVLLLLAFIQFIFITPDMLINDPIQFPGERIAVWVFIFIVIGIFQKWHE